jgi:cardiolipin synthase
VRVPLPLPPAVSGFGVGFAAKAEASVTIGKDRYEAKAGIAGFFGGIRDFIDEKFERPFATANDGFVAVDPQGRVVAGNAVGTRVRDRDMFATPLDNVFEVVADGEARDVTFSFANGTQVQGRTDDAGLEELSLSELDGATLTRGLDPKKGGITKVGITTPNGSGAEANLLVLPKDYDGPIFVCDIDSTLRHTNNVSVALGDPGTEDTIEGARELLETVAARGIPIVYLSAAPDRVGNQNRDFLDQMPEGILLDRPDFGLKELLPFGQVENQADYKGKVLSELESTYPQAQLFGLGDDKYGDAHVYTRHGVEAWIHDVRADEKNMPANFEGKVVSAYTPAFRKEVGAALDAALARSASFGGTPVQGDAAVELSRTLDTLTAVKATTGNKVDLYVDGQEARPVILEAIDSAERSLYYETFNFLPGEKISEQIADKLIAAHQRGVKVRVAVDAFGSRELGPMKNETVARMRDAGVEVHSYNPLDNIDDVTNVRRDHRKVIVADNETAFVGGMNTGDHYFSDAGEVDHKHDLFTRIQGPAVEQIRDAFLQTWKEVGGSLVPAREKALPAEPEQADGVKSRVVAFTPGKDDNIRAAYLAMIGSAEKNVYLENVFPLANDVKGALIAASRRGVDVRIVTSAHGGLLGMNARTDFQALLDAGVRIYEYPTKVHTKALSVDGRVASVGSANVDEVALARNQEIINIIEDPAWVARFDERLFEEDFVGDDHGRKTLELPRKLDDNVWERLRNLVLEKVWPDSLE